MKRVDVIVGGGGPAVAGAAIYAARKGLNVAVIDDRIGGQVKETVGIENLISTPYTTGNELAGNLRKHMEAYPIALFENRKVVSAEKTDNGHLLTLQSNEQCTAPAIIVGNIFCKLQISVFNKEWQKLSLPQRCFYSEFCPGFDMYGPS